MPSEGTLTPALLPVRSVTSKQWTRIADMHSARSCFTPCQVGEELYLCSFSRDSSLFEAFNPVDETFRLLPASLHSTVFGSVTVLYDDTVYLIGYGNLRVKWQPP